MFRRRRDAGEGRHEARAGRHERHGLEPGGDPDGDFTGDDFSGDELTGDELTGDEGPQQAGPWDSREQYPQRLRVDVGSLLIPANEGQDVGLELSDDQSQFVAASVDIPEGKLQIRALAAPKSGGLWEDERAVIIETIAQAGGQAGEAEGPFGPEVHALEPVPVPVPVQGGGQQGGSPAGLQPARFLGVDGPRWLLVGKISGPAAASPEQARALEEVFADIVVVRGDHPAAPRDLLDIMLPAEMREALAQQMAEAQAQAEQEQGQFLMPTERGPEITETR